jgi:flavin-dependent dehydrogenase
MDKTDVLIIGGGITGLTLAKFLAEDGIDFILLEADKHFYGKACGEGITYSIGEFNFLDLYESNKGIERITEKFIIRTGCGEIEAKITNINTNKKEVEEELARQAVAKGAEIHMEEKVKDLVEKDNRIKVMPQNIEARVVVGADGFNSIVRSFMGIEKPKSFGIASSGYWVGKEPGDECITEFKKSMAKYGYAWWFPRKKDWNIGIGTVKPKLFRRQLANFKIRYPEVKEWRTGVVPISKPLKSFGKNTILVGDSASQVIALMADGILPGMICAKKAAETLKELSNQNFKDPDLSKYEKAWKDAIGKMFTDGYLAYSVMMKLYFSEYLLHKFLRILEKIYEQPH